MLYTRGTWNIHNMKAVYQKHGASLRSLRFCPTRQPAIDKTASLLEEMRDQCPRLEELHIAMLRDQGSPTEMAIYKTLATLPVLRYLVLYVGSRNYRVERHQGRMAPYDNFDQQLPGRYGNIRRTFINRAIDENFTKTVFHLVSSPGRVRGLKELRVVGIPTQNPGRSSIYKQSEKVLYHICRSWKVLRGVRDDRPDEVIIEEVRTDGRPRKPTPRDLDSRIEKIFRRIWPGSEDGTSDWRDDWHSILQVEGDSATA